jgi:hypothetical protein
MDSHMFGRLAESADETVLGTAEAFLPIVGGIL